MITPMRRPSGCAGRASSRPSAGPRPKRPDQVLPLALAGYFQVRAGEDIPAGVARLDDAASRDLGLAQYYRGLALAPLPAEAGHAEQAVADLRWTDLTAARLAALAEEVAS